MGNRWGARRRGSRGQRRVTCQWTRLIKPWHGRCDEGPNFGDSIPQSSVPIQAQDRAAAASLLGPATVARPRWKAWSGGGSRTRSGGSRPRSGGRAAAIPKHLAKVSQKQYPAFANPVRAGIDQFVVQPHLQLCHAIELSA